VADPDAFGDLTLKVTGLDSSLAYLMILRTGSREITSDRIHHLADTVFRFHGLLPAKYQVEMIEDLNENGFWDTGSYFHRRQPERKRIFELESLRAAWEVESTVSW
jgi:hypothetical protein